jgi:hypothetical protein
MPWKEPAERHNDELIAAIERATHSINHTLREGFKLLAETASLPPGSAQVDNSALIEANAERLKKFTEQLTNSLPPSS